MKTLLVLISAVFIFTGCYSTQPDIRTVTSYETKVVLPTEEHYSYYNVDTLDPNLSKKSKDKIIEDLLKYSASLQSTIMLYENRVDKLTEWSNEMKKIYKVKE